MSGTGSWGTRVSRTGRPQSSTRDPKFIVQNALGTRTTDLTVRSAVRRPLPVAHFHGVVLFTRWLVALRVAVPCRVRATSSPSVTGYVAASQSPVPHSPHVRAGAHRQDVPGQAGHGHPRPARRWEPAAYRSGTGRPRLRHPQHLCCGTAQCHRPANESAPGAQELREREAPSCPSDGERSGERGVQRLPGQPEPAEQTG